MILVSPKNKASIESFQIWFKKTYLRYIYLVVKMVLYSYKIKNTTTIYHSKQVFGRSLILVTQYSNYLQKQHNLFGTLLLNNAKNTPTATHIVLRQKSVESKATCCSSRQSNWWWSQKTLLLKDAKISLNFPSSTTSCILCHLMNEVKRQLTFSMLL